MTADELLERSSSRLLTEYQLLYQIKAEEDDEAVAREAAIAEAEEADRTGPREDDETDGEPEEPDDLSADDWQRMIEEQRALIARALAGTKADG